MLHTTCIRHVCSLLRHVCALRWPTLACNGLHLPYICGTYMTRWWRSRIQIDWSLCYWEITIRRDLTRSLWEIILFKQCISMDLEKVLYNGSPTTSLAFFDCGCHPLGATCSRAGERFCALRNMVESDCRAFNNNCHRAVLLSAFPL